MELSRMTILKSPKLIIFKEYFIKNAFSQTLIKLTITKMSGLHPLLCFQGQSSHFSVVSGLFSSTVSEQMSQDLV